MRGPAHNTDHGYRPLGPFRAADYPSPLTSRQSWTIGGGLLAALALIVVGASFDPGWQCPSGAAFGDDPNCYSTDLYQPLAWVPPALIGVGIGLAILALVVALSPWGRHEA